MSDLDPFASLPIALWIVSVLIVAGLAHGTMGFGFPMVSTPMIAIATDMQTAVLISLAPNLAVNTVSILRGGDWRSSIARHWPVVGYVFIGAVVGTRVLMLTDPEPLKLLLALMLVIHLRQARVQTYEWRWMARNPRSAAAFFGLLAGFLSGTVNVAVPPLVIYFSALGLSAPSMAQILNLCFLVGRSTQIVSAGYSGWAAASTWIETGVLVAVSLAALFVGMRLQQRIDARSFSALLRKVLWLMALVLTLQVVHHYFF